MLKPNFILTMLSITGLVALCSCEQRPATSTASTGSAAASPAQTVADTNTPPMEAAQSVVVTHDLESGPTAPSLADMVLQLDRRHHPTDGAGRTFAILEAFTQPGADAGKFRLSLRVSTEEPGVGEIIFRRTGQSLWKNRITAALKKPSFNAGSLTILFQAEDGKSFTVDGSANPQSIFDATLKEAAIPVGQAWPEGEVRDLAFIYSACGCPIHVKCRRVGDRTVRTEAATQMIFPDDPAVLQVINSLMRW